MPDEPLRAKVLHHETKDGRSYPISVKLNKDGGLAFFEPEVGDVVYLYPEQVRDLVGFLLCVCDHAFTVHHELTGWCSLCGTDKSDPDFPEPMCPVFATQQEYDKSFEEAKL